jgi:hypothetical protein
MILRLMILLHRHQPHQPHQPHLPHLPRRLLPHLELLPQQRRQTQQLLLQLLPFGLLQQFLLG